MVSASISDPYRSFSAWKRCGELNILYFLSKAFLAAR